MSAIYFLALVLFYANSNCIMAHTCFRDTEWNSYSVSKNLRNWIDSFQPNETYKYIEVEFHSRGKKNFPRHIRTLNNQSLAWMSPLANIYSKFHGGFLYGVYHESIKNISGNHSIFVYPDMRTVIVGEYLNGVLISGQVSKISKERCRNGIKEIEVADPNPEIPFVKYQTATSSKFAGDPTLVDAYEVKNVYVNSSQNGLGDGLFAKRKIRPFELIVYYYGMVFENSRDKIFNKNQSLETMYSLHTNLIRFGEYQKINIIEDYWSVHKYRATLGHKANHSFKRSNSILTYGYNPKYGRILCLVSDKTIEYGEEILTQYNYNIQSLFVPLWYTQLFEKEVGKLPEAVLKLKNGKTLKVKREKRDQIRSHYLTKRSVDFV